MTGLDSMSPEALSAIASQEELARQAIGTACRALAEGDANTALPWLERAVRLVPNDPVAGLLLASMIAASDPSRAAAMLQALAAIHPHHQGISTGLIAGALRQGDAPLAAARLHALLSHGAPPAGPGFAALAGQVAQASGTPGWVALSASGALIVQGKQVAVALDGRRITLPAASNGAIRAAIPAGWQQARTLAAESAGTPLIGSPVDIQQLLRVEGCVTQCDAAGIHGWAWHPDDPGTAAILGLHAEGQAGPAAGVIAGGEGDDPAGRRFAIDAATLRQAAAGDVLTLRGPDGKIVPGGVIPARAFPAAPPAKRRAKWAARGLCIVLPLTGEAAILADCLASLAAHGMAAAPRVIAVDTGDARTDLASLAREAGIACLASGTPGVPAALEAGLQHTMALGEACDVLLLPAPCPLPANLPSRLAAALRASPEIGLTQPVTGEGFEQDKFQAASCAGLRLAIGTISAPLVLIGHACLEAMRAPGQPLLRHESFVTASALFTDFAMRAASAGWQASLACDIFLPTPASDLTAVQSALDSRDALSLTQIHSGVTAALAQNAEAQASALRRSALAQWKAGDRRKSVILVTHADGGGVERHVRERAAALRAEGQRAIVIRPASDAAGEAMWSVADGAEDCPKPLLFPAPAGLDELTALLRAGRPSLVEFHHDASHLQEICGLAAKLDVRYDVVVHDFAAICPRVTLVGGTGRYCGEPADVTECDDCIADHGVRIGVREPVAGLRARSGVLLGAARRIVVPSADGARRLRRYFPALSPEILPWEDDSALSDGVPRAPARAVGRTSRDPLTICIAGAVGQDKGYEVILACARDAARRRLDLTFTIVGHTIDDARLLDTGRVFITGRYQEDEAVALIRAQRADIGFLPSVWPETWCYALSALWRAGLWTLAFALGAPAERIAATGAGRTIPAGMPAPRLNDYMLGLLPAAAAGHPRLAASHG